MGRDAILKAKLETTPRVNVGFIVEGRAVPRQGMEIRCTDGVKIGITTSGIWSPTLDKGIGTGYVKVEDSAIGNEIHIMIRDRAVVAKIVETPFVKKD